MRKGMILSVIVIVSLFLAALTPGVAFAEGEAPETAPPVDTPVMTTTAAVSTEVEVLAENGAVLVDAVGAAVPLASQTALEVLCDPDPWFYGACPGGKCTGYTTINQALDAWANNKGTGFIYLEGGFNQTENVSIYGTDPGMNTLKGIVWDTKTGGEKPRLNGGIGIGYFITGFTLQGIAVTSNGIYFDDNIGVIKLSDVSVNNPGGDGIYIDNQGPIILNQVAADNNKKTGATLMNTYFNGTKFISSGNITITNSSFNRNGLTAGYNLEGLYINTLGNVMLNGVTAIGNNGDGADIYAYGKSLIIKNSIFSRNNATPDSSVYGYGIWIAGEATTSITLENVVLEGNETDGAKLSAHWNVLLKKVYAANNGKKGILISGSTGANNVTILDSTFYENKENNLEIHAFGMVKIVNLLSTLSMENGLVVYNTVAVNPASVTIQGAVLSDNAYMGGSVYSKGTITVSGITANGNGENGLYLDNHEADATGSVIVLGTLGLNQFNDNQWGPGIEINTYGNVSLASIQANGNRLEGVDVTGYGDNSSVKLLNVEAGNNTLSGVFIGITSGAVTLSKVAASGNTGNGIYIDNRTYVARSVVISSSSANNNGDQGIIVYSIGAITLSGVTASGNIRYGAKLVNNEISLPTTQVPQGITVMKSTFDKNGDHGLYLATLRKITLISNNASENTNCGVYGFNIMSTVSSSIVVSGVNHFNFNGGSGLYINSSGAITISGVVTYGNETNGIYANTTSGATLKNSQMEGNGWVGVYLGTHLTTTLSGLTVLQNGFGDFDDAGIYIFSTGKVFISSSTVMGNSGYGLLIDVANKDTDSKIAPNVVVFGNDAGIGFDDGNIWVH